MQRLYFFLYVFFFIFFFLLQLYLIHQPLIDLDEGIYTTTFMLISQGHAAYTQTFLSQPPGFLLAVYPGFILFGKSLEAARLTMSLWFCIGLISIVWLSFELKKKSMGFFIFGILFFATTVSSRFFVFQSDMLISIFSVLSITAFLRYHHTKNVLWAIFSAFWLSFAFWTKYSFFLLLPLGILFYFAHQQHKTPKKTLYALTLFCTTGILFSLFVVSFFPLRQLIVNTIQIRLAQFGVGGGNFFLYIQHNIVLFSLSILTVLLLLFNRRKFTFPLFPLFLWTATIFVILAVYHPLFIHHLTLFYIPLIILFSYLVFDTFSSYSSHLSWIGFATCIAGFLFYTAFFYPLHTKSVATVQEKEAATFIDVHASPQEAILTDDEYLYPLSKRYPLPLLADTSFVRIAADNVSLQSIEKILLQHPPKIIIPLTGRLITIHNFSEIVKGYQKEEKQGITFYVRL